MAEKPRVSQKAQGSYIAQATHGGTATVTVYSSPPSLSDQNRARFLVRLHTRYRDLLEQSLQGAVHMELQLAGHPEAVAPPVRLLYLPAKSPTHLLPVGTSLTQIYAQAGQELLVLGEPGTGKSTLLLELACDLVEHAERDPTLLLPVIVPLSSWASKRQPLEQWLDEQVALLYDISLSLSRRWVQDECLLLLLDGLDEVEEEARVACIGAINVYHHQHLHPLVVCSRKTEYEAAALEERLVLHSAVVVQALTKEQVDGYLEQSGEPVAALRTTLREFPVLQEVATTPLMLSILILTYQGNVVSELPVTDSLPELQRQIFAAYVQRMIERKKKLARSSPQALVGWLRWVARQMRRHDQTVFYLEHLQPDALPSAQQRTYVRQAVRLPALLIGILASLTISALFSLSDPVSLLQYAALGGLLGWLFSRPASGSGAPPKRPAGAPRRERLHRLGKGIPPGIVVGLIVGLSWGLQLGKRYGPGDWLREGFISGIVIGISILVLSVLLPSFPSDLVAATTRTTRRWHVLVHLSQTIHRRRVWLMLVILGTGYGLGVELNLVGLREGFISGIVIGISILVLSVLLPSFPSDLVAATTRTTRRWHVLVRLSQTIHGRRVWLMLAILGTGYGLSVGLRYGLIYGLSVGLSVGLRDGLSVGLRLGLISVLVSLILSAQAEGITLTERLRWTWHSLVRSLLTPKHVKEALLVTSVIGLGYGLSLVLYLVPRVWLSVGLSEVLSLGLSLGLLYWILLGLFQGIESSRIEDHARRLPNQGIRRSLYNSALLALISSVLIGVIGMLSGGLRFVPRTGLGLGLSLALSLVLSDGLRYGLRYGLLLAVCGGLLVCTSRGGLAVLRHYIIRLLLARSHTFPWHAPQFLEEATARILLRRVGGGYSFPHRLLLDYFADLPQETP